MKNEQMEQKPLHKLLITKLQSLLDIEMQITKSLPKLIKASTNVKLKMSFTAHLAETRQHVMRLKKIFSLLGRKPSTTTVEGIRGIEKDAKWVLENIEKGPALDSNLIAIAAYVELYEMAGYMMAKTWARAMNHTEVVHVLSQTLREEQGALRKIQMLSKSVNKGAL